MYDVWWGMRGWHPFGGGQGTGKGSEVEAGREWWEYLTKVTGTLMVGKRTDHWRQAAGKEGEREGRRKCIESNVN